MRAAIMGLVAGWLLTSPPGARACVIDGPGDFCPDPFQPRKSVDGALRQQIEELVNPNAPPALTKDEILDGLRPTKPATEACGRRYGARGIAPMRIVVSRAGKISSVFAGGKLDGTALGLCVEQAIHKAGVSFRPTRDQSFVYPASLNGPTPRAPSEGNTPPPTPPPVPAPAASSSPAGAPPPVPRP